jgi:colicin import membrane protein
MTTLYGVLGVDSDATADQIEKAYGTFKSRLQTGFYGLSAEEANNQAILIRDAFATLSNPILRQRYDQRLSLANQQNSTLTSGHSHEVAHSSIFGIKSIVLIGAIVLGGIYLYNNNAKERDALRIAHEHEVQMKAVQVLEDREKQNAKVQDVVLERTAVNAEAQQLRAQQQQFERESAQQQQLDLQRQRLEMQQQQQQAQLERQQRQEVANQARQEELERQRRLQAQKNILQALERDHYGKTITR